MANGTEGRIRQLVLALSGLVFLATLTELVLEEHTQELLQLIPFVLCGVGLVALAVAFYRPQRVTLFALRAAMTVVGIGGLVGIGIHLWENLSFEREIRPNAATIDALFAALKGAAPLLAPGALTFAALLAIVATYRHPAS